MIQYQINMAFDAIHYICIKYYKLYSRGGTLEPEVVIYL